MTSSILRFAFCSLQCVCRRPVLKWGPAGMQQLSETRQNGLRILACAGNTAPDHIDHLHGLPAFLKMLLDER